MSFYAQGIFDFFVVADEPRPRGSEKLSGQERYRIRKGDDRIVYSINDDAQTVEIFKIGHRSEI
jgi:mRNA interferase RelE/StbE